MSLKCIFLIIGFLVVYFSPKDKVSTKYLLKQSEGNFSYNFSVYIN